MREQRGVEPTGGLHGQELHDVAKALCERDAPASKSAVAGAAGQPRVGAVQVCHFACKDVKPAQLTDESHEGEDTELRQAGVRRGIPRRGRWVGLCFL